MDNYSYLKKILSYAKETGSWSKRLFLERADIVCAYGLGKYFEDVFEKWGFKDYYHINYCCDKNVEHGKKIANSKNLSFVSYEELLKLNQTKRVVVILFVGNGEKVFKEFVQRGLYVVELTELFFEKLCQMPNDPKWFSENTIEAVYEMLEDDESRQIYTNVLSLRMALPLAKIYWSDIKSDGEYFHFSYMPLTGQEIFCDCGAYTGDTIERFLESVNGEFKRIYAYEMAPENFALLRQRVYNLGESYGRVKTNCTLFNAGVWNQFGQISFGKEDLGPAESYGVFKTENIQYAKAVTIDETVNGPVTFIKMDIEGAELNALQGSEKKMKAYHPKLAICLYHRLQDFWAIPAYVKSIVPEYKIYIRHHQNDLGGTVMYSVPR